MVTVLPEGPLAFFSSIVFLAGFSGDILHGSWNRLRTATIGDDQMNMVAGDTIIENGDTIPLSGFEQQLQPSVSIYCKLEKKLPLMAPVGQMPDIARYKMSVGSGHDGFSCLSRLECSFGGENMPFKA